MREEARLPTSRAVLRLPHETLTRVLSMSLVCNVTNHYLHRNRVGSIKATSNGMWRNVLPTIFAALNKAGVRFDDDVERGQLYEFGVFNGRSVRMLHSMRAFSSTFIWALDSFQGLPTEDSSSPRLQSGAWSPGAFADDPRLQLRSEIGADGIGFVAGFFNESLSPARIAPMLPAMRPAKYVDIDVDLHVSSYQALDFLFSHGIIRPGTISMHARLCSSQPCFSIACTAALC